MKSKLITLTALSLIGLALPGTVLASSLTVRLGQPKTPTNQDTFKLTFVALDINGGDITVSCYKKSPSDSDFVKFDADKPLIPGGNTDYCNVTSSILNTAGTYSFKVKAVTSSETKESSIVSVDYNTSGPSTPGSYSKEKINSCDYRIKFQTADDGRTSKVELYRSDTNSISIDSGHLVATQNIGPHTDGSFVNSVPDCGKDYYFAIRAVDGYENVSGIVGDSTTKIITETTTTTGTTVQGALPVSPNESQVAGGATGAEVSPNPSTNPSESGSGSATTNPTVLGTQTSKLGNLKWLAIPLLLIAAFFFRKAKKRS